MNKNKNTISQQAFGNTQLQLVNEQNDNKMSQNSANKHKFRPQINRNSQEMDPINKMHNIIKETRKSQEKSKYFYDDSVVPDDEDDISPIKSYQNQSVVQSGRKTQKSKSRSQSQKRNSPTKNTQQSPITLKPLHRCDLLFEEAKFKQKNINKHQHNKSQKILTHREKSLERQKLKDFRLSQVSQNLEEQLREMNVSEEEFNQIMQQSMTVNQNLLSQKILPEEYRETVKQLQQSNFDEEDRNKSRLKENKTINQKQSNTYHKILLENNVKDQELQYILDINLDHNTKVQLNVFEGDDLNQILRRFQARHQLTDKKISVIKEKLEKIGIYKKVI
eukprot:403353315